MWQPGDTVVWRGIYRNRVWHAQTVIVVEDSDEETLLALLPGTECVAPVDYVAGKKQGKQRWNFKDKPWALERFDWHTNRLLFLLEPHKYYSTILFWRDASNEFVCYYINFQLPFRRSHCGIDTLDLDLDLIVHPDLHYEWKDVEDYQKSIENEVILPAWTRRIETAKQEVLNKLEQQEYPFDGSWLDWLPDPGWIPPKLPENWDKI